MTDEFCESYFRKLIYADEAQRKTTKAFLANRTDHRDWATEYYRISCTMPASIRNANPFLVCRTKEELYLTIKSTLQEMYNGRRSTETDLFGKSGGYIRISLKIQPAQSVLAAKI